jgi:hypothetical protein
MAIWYNVWPFGVVCGPLINFSLFGPCLVKEKSGNPVPIAASSDMKKSFFIQTFYSSTALSNYFDSGCGPR